MYIYKFDLFLWWSRSNIKKYTRSAKLVLNVLLSYIHPQTVSLYHNSSVLLEPGIETRWTLR